MKSPNKEFFIIDDGGEVWCQTGHNALAKLSNLGRT